MGSRRVGLPDGTLALLATCVVTVTTAGATVRGADDAFLQTLHNHAPMSGAAHVMFVESRTGRRLIGGLQFDSGAWYFAFADNLSGVDSSGRAFRGRPIPGGATYVGDDPANILDTAIEFILPVVISWDFAKRPGELLDSVESSEGGFVVRMTAPLGSRRAVQLPPGFDTSRKTVTYWFDAMGRVVRSQGAGGDATAISEWRYEDPRGAAKGIPSYCSRGELVIAGLELREGSTADEFSKAAVEQRAASAFTMADAQPLWFGKSVTAIVDAARKRSVSARVSGTGAGPAPASGGWSWSVWSLAGGSALVVLAVFLRWRRQS